MNTASFLSKKSTTMYSFYVVCVLICLSSVCSSDNVTETVPSNATSSNIGSTTDDLPIGKHESLASCLSFDYGPGEYELLPNGSIYIDIYKLTLNESHYILLEQDRVKLCVPFEGGDSHEDKDYVAPSTYLTIIGLSISMVSLFVHLFVFSVVPDLRNLPGWNLAALCASLFISYFLILLIDRENVKQHPDACVAIAFMTHFFFLASILWMSIMSYDVFMSLLRATGSLRMSSTQFAWKKFAIYCSCSFGIALLFAVAGLLAEVLDDIPKPYKPEFKKICWFSQRLPLLIFFGGPVIVLSCLNFIFFGLSAYTLHCNKMNSDKDGQKSILQRRYLMYFRLSVIMGTTWIVGIVAAGTNVSWLWYIFVILNTLQGFFIFLAFTCSKKVKNYFRAKLFGGRRPSQQTLSPTFQSYCFYANSIEKDLDKIVEVNKEKTDTIVIHL